MKRYLVVMVIAVTAVFAPLSSYAGETLPVPQGAPAVAAPADAATPAPAAAVEDMAGEVVALFPRAEGKVTFADEGRVKLDIGSADGIKPGMEALLFRGGKPIIHPVTKAVLGASEEPLGKALVDEVSEHGSSGRVTELLVTRVVEGDTARLSTERTGLLVATVGAAVDPVVLDRFMAGLRGSGRFDIAGPTELPAGAGIDGAQAARMAAVSRVDNVVALSTKPSGKDRQEAGLTLYSSGGEEMLSLSEVVDVTPEVYSESVMDFPMVRGDYRGFFVTESLPYRGTHMAAGNVMGDGKTDIVVSDNKDLAAYRFVDRIMRELWKLPGSPAARQLALDCADMDNNGKDEVYVTAMEGGNVASYVLEYDGTSVRQKYGPCGLFFRVLDVPGQKRRLIAGTRGMNSAYSGALYEYSWKDGGLVRGDKLALPSKIKDPYGFALVDLVPDKDKPAGGAKDPLAGLEVVWVDDSDFVQVLGMDGERIWKSGERYGGYDTFFEVDQKGVVGPNSDPRGRVKGRVLVEKGDDGGYEIVLTKNIPMTYAFERLKGYTSAEIYSLFWNGSGLEPLWSIKNIEGFIADIYVGGIIKEGRDELLVLLDPTMKLEKSSRKLSVGSLGDIANVLADKSSLMVYKAPQR